MRRGTLGWGHKYGSCLPQNESLQNSEEKKCNIVKLRGNCSEGFKFESVISGTCRIVKDKRTNLSARIYKTVVYPPGIHFI
jgi:hypothetical protein